MRGITYNMLGLRVQALTPHDIVSIIAQSVENGQRYTIANHNLHSFYVYHHDPKARPFFDRADYAHIDGMAIIALARLLGIPLRREHRATYIDLLPCILDAAERHSWKIFYLGSKPGVAERAAQQLRIQYPKLQMRTHHGHFSAEQSSLENKEVLEEIKAYAPQILMVGMGMPRQENWIADNLQSLCCNATLCSGAALDYVAGEIPTPPRWLGQVGLEWLYRLAAEPERLWRRYLVEPWFVLRVIGQQYLSGPRPKPIFRYPFK
jgi:N-acetylglucosaminyldiphosphoundecaprenol N-acetyl-beta-D-mannosaminyltransferase